MTDQEIDRKYVTHGNLSFVTLALVLMVFIVMYAVSKQGERITALEKQVKELQEQIQP